MECIISSFQNITSYRSNWWESLSPDNASVTELCHETSLWCAPHCWFLLLKQPYLKREVSPDEHIVISPFFFFKVRGCIITYLSWLKKKCFCLKLLLSPAEFRYSSVGHICLYNSKCSSNLTQNHASISTIFHTQFKNARLFFLLGVNKGRLKSWNGGYFQVVRYHYWIYDCCLYFSLGIFIIAMICDIHSKYVMSNWNTCRGGQK